MTAGTNTGTRGLILDRIRAALGPRPTSALEEYHAIAREYRQSVDRLEHYQVGVYRAEPATLPRTVEQVVAARSKTRLIVPRGVPREWLPRIIDVVEDDGLSHADLDRVDGVLTACSLAIAATGTIVLRHHPAEGRRALTLVPDYHLCVVFVDQIVQTVPEAIRVLAADPPSLVTTISGPSATADIEMTRIRGVHGPRTLDVIVVSEGGAI
jgi:L-lactate dehydrogenase complex protein LldG